MGERDVVVCRALEEKAGLGTCSGDGSGGGLVGVLEKTHLSHSPDTTDELGVSALEGKEAGQQPAADPPQVLGHALRHEAAECGPGRSQGDELGGQGGRDPSAGYGG